ncbi:hypothetical protein LTR04_005494 [Oleoguttula sp. CCFEE 6159]|nr:hypothetical protein LTR04_005494 [Oleoguttula sp. CCFEE 6159]
MSSRALRKAQRDREEQERLQKLQAQLDEEENEEEAEDGQVNTASSQPSMFEMLSQHDEDGEHEPAVEPALSDPEDQEEQAATTATDTTSAAGAKRKKRKVKGKKTTAKTDKASAQDTLQLDEIDLALQSLSASATEENATSDLDDRSKLDPAVQEVCKLLSVDAQHLHASNEMRRLFGRAALGNDDGDEAGEGRRRNRNPRQGGLAGALAGRNTPNGRDRGLAALGLRRNIFIQGKEEWPGATSGGLGMEVVEKRPDGVVEYNFVHSRSYQDVQRQFETCVVSMDPNRLVQLLQYNPYHISTLLQVSEIAKQERENATSGDLLERALFSFGRAVHSTFPKNVSEGKARLDFRRPENREFWLAAYRYIANLGMRATWRTAFEWAKLLLSLDPEGDPYCVGLVIDQFALRSRQAQQLVDMAQSKTLGSRWKNLENIHISLGLAYTQVHNSQKGKQELYTAFANFPWVAARLFQELELDPIPPAIWGKSPRTSSETLYTELYVSRAKDIWNTTEAKSLLMEIASAISTELPPPAIVDTPITVNEARHTILLDNPALIAFIPRSLSSRVTSSSDPLPPEISTESYSSALDLSQTRQVGNELLQTEGELEEFNTLQYLEQLREESHASGALDEALEIFIQLSARPDEELFNNFYLPLVRSDHRHGLTLEGLRTLIQENGTSLEDYAVGSPKREMLDRYALLALPRDLDVQAYAFAMCSVRQALGSEAAELIYSAMQHVETHSAFDDEPVQ